MRIHFFTAPFFRAGRDRPQTSHPSLNQHGKEGGEDDCENTGDYDGERGHGTLDGAKLHGFCRTHRVCRSAKSDAAGDGVGDMEETADGFADDISEDPGRDDGSDGDGDIAAELFGKSHADGSILTEGKIDPMKLAPITFDAVHGKYLPLGEAVGRAWSEGRIFMK